MKLCCDICSKKKASVFCSADEAALCDECDSRIHHANKVAFKHQRVSLLHPSSSDASPLCDICQENKAILFCQQDRAILCINCDVQIHRANELTKKHDRFLLTGVKLNPIPNPKSQYSIINMTECVNSELTNSVGSASGDGSTSNTISEYLMEMLPGWQVEDLLDSSLHVLDSSKGYEDDILFLDTNFDSRAKSNENMGLWVPQVATIMQPSMNHLDIYEGDEFEGEDLIKKGSRKRIDEVFTVPQINQQSSCSKKSRLYCYEDF